MKHDRNVLMILASIGLGLANPVREPAPEAALAVSAPDFSPPSPPELPSTPAGKIARAYLAAYNDQSEAAAVKFEEAYRVEARLKEISAADRGARMRGMRENTGTLTVEEVMAGEGGSFTARVRGSKGVVMEMRFVSAKEDGSKLDFIEVATFDTPPQAVTGEQRAAAIEGAAKAMETGYVFPEVGARMASKLREKLKAGGYDAVKDDVALARVVTADLVEVSHDKHIGMGVRPARDAGQGQTIQGPSDQEMARENYGFRKVERLDGNIGYLKFDVFVEDDKAKETALAALRFIAHCDVVIFDLRQNGGGSPDMIRFITSSLFDKPTLLNQMMDREGKVVEEFTTLADFAGPHFGADVPVYVLTSGRTFSGAEEFGYNLKSLKRGTLVGETTGGGAHPVREERVGERFGLRVPYMRAHNPITKTNWEGKGVEPDVKVPAERALEKALELARAKLKAARP